MRELARGFQVFCVTHLPQIARRADHHYRVLKQSDDEQTRVSVVPMIGEERVHELARMMGRESAANLRHARELLGEIGETPATSSTRSVLSEGKRPAKKTKKG